jgi:hypothetical protein
MDQAFADPRTVAAITRARQAHARARGASGTSSAWVDDEHDDSAQEAEQLAAEALTHLDAGRWDEAIACAEAAQSLAEDAGEPRAWREFYLLVEEAAETGRGSAAAHPGRGEEPL